MRTLVEWPRALIKVLILIGVYGPALSSCTTMERQADLGIQVEHDGFVPARIAILPCITWPEGSRYKTKPLSNAKADTLNALCTAFDRFVLEGFSSQPFMKGYSPNFVIKSLTAASKPQHLDLLPKLWAHAATDCAECTNIASFYRASISKRTPWQLWLGETSAMTKGSDAILVPTVLYAWERRYNDRGVLVIERAASAALLLISTASGDLIWTQARSAVVPVRKLEANLNNQELQPPDWNQVSSQIITEHLWADFPGRQVY